jgi:hypothetical protein
MKLKHSFFTIVSVALSQVATAQTPSIANPSFELDTFTVFPGYIEGNASITGWSADAVGRVGLNPSGGNPFTNNGTIPDGLNAGFIQATNESGVVTLASTDGITGLVVGNTYNLTYDVNSRLVAENLDPEMALFIDGLEVLRNNVNSVGAQRAYKPVGYTFVATAETMSLEIDVNVTGGSTDETLLVDDFTITEIEPEITFSPWNGDATSGIDSSLVYTHAFNLGQAMGMESDVDVNGVTFVGISGGSPAVAGSFSLNMPNRTTDNNNLLVAEDGSSTLASDFVFNGGFGNLIMEGLTPGATYRTSIFSVGFGNGFDRNSTFTGTSVDEELTITHNNFGDNNGIRIDYEFVASGATETISVTAILGTQTFHTYAFANALLEEAEVPTEIVINSCMAEEGTVSGQMFTIDFTAPGLVDVYASDDLVTWSLVGTEVASSPFIEDNVADERRFYAVVNSGDTFPPAP